jgi:hypothetical protein
MVIAGTLSTQALAQELRLPPAVPGAPANSSTQSAPPQAASPPPASQPDAPRNLDNFVEINKRVAGAFSTAGYKVSGLMTAIYEDRVKDVPDDQKTRSLVFSILKAFADKCGPPSQDVTIAASLYVSPDARRANRGDGFTVLAEQLKDLAIARDRGLASGDIAGSIRSLQEKRAVLTQEGLDDGLVFLSRHECGTDVYSRFSNNMYGIIMSRSSADAAPYDELRFWALMSPEYRQQNNIPDPAVEMAKRKTAELKRGAEKSCSQNFERAGFCKCAIGKLEVASVSDADWAALSGNFRMVAALGKDRDSIMGAVRSCY